MGLHWYQIIIFGIVKSPNFPRNTCSGINTTLWGGLSMSKHARAFTILAAFILCMIFLGAMNEWEDNVEPTNDFFKKFQPHTEMSKCGC